MKRAFLLPLFLVLAGGVQAGEYTGRYVEARTCDVWTGPCFANADFNLGGKHAVMAWQIEGSKAASVELDGLSIVAVVSAANTLGLDQVSPAKAVLIVDSRADRTQREALVRMAQRQGGGLLANVVAVHTAPIKVDLCECKGGTCAEMDAGVARIRTRCLNTTHDKACGNESPFYPPLARGVQAKAAAVVEHSFRGAGLRETWSDFERRGAYVGSFSARD